MLIANHHPNAARELLFIAVGEGGTDLYDDVFRVIGGWVRLWTIFWASEIGLGLAF